MSGWFSSSDCRRKKTGRRFPSWLFPAVVLFWTIPLPVPASSPASSHHISLLLPRLPKSLRFFPFSFPPFSTSPLLLLLLFSPPSCSFYKGTHANGLHLKSGTLILWRSGGFRKHPVVCFPSPPTANESHARKILIYTGKCNTQITEMECRRKESGGGRKMGKTKAQEQTNCRLVPPQDAAYLALCLQPSCEIKKN